MILDGKFFISDLFNQTDGLKKDLLVSGMSRDLIENLFNGSFDLVDVYKTFNNTIDFEPFCRNHFLNHILTVDNSTDVNILIQALCQMNIRNLTMDINTFVNDLNHDVINRYVSSRKDRERKYSNFIFFCSLAIFLNYSMRMKLERKLNN